MRITKTYCNMKAAHRQWRHPGHCQWVHGENWTFHIDMKSETLDSMGFVIDFGDLRDLKAVMDDLFDHTLLIDEDDPRREVFEMLKKENLAKVQFVTSASAEGLARFVFDLATSVVAQKTDGRVRVCGVTVEEDSKNKAYYER